MNNYLEKYNNLPKDLRDKISAPHVMNAIHDLENRYSVFLAALVMRVVVKDIKVKELQNFFVYNIGINADKAAALVKELKDKVFSEIANYIDYISNEPTDEIGDNFFADVPDMGGQENNESLKFESDDVGSIKKGADFYFSIEDEDEVRNQAKDFGSLDKREQLARQVEFKIGSIIEQIDVIFSSEDMLNRLKQILKTYLRGVRDKIDTKQALERDVENGGLGLEDEISENILKIVDVINKNEQENPSSITKPRKFRLPEDSFGLSSANDNKTSGHAMGGDVDYDFSKFTKPDEQNTGKIGDQNVLLIKEESDTGESSGAAIDPVMQKAFRSGDNSSFQSDPSDMELLDYDEEDGETDRDSDDEIDDDENEIELERQREGGASSQEDRLVLDLSKLSNPTFGNKRSEKKEAKEIEQNHVLQVGNIDSGMIAKARNVAPLNINNQEATGQISGEMAGKVKMEDIKKVTKLVGPLEEISTMSLVDFRRINKDPEVAVKKIFDMFQLLEEDSFGKRLEGIKAWRQSPINKLYLSIGQESIVGQKNITEVIEDRKKVKNDYLSKEEFNAIMGLNKSLRY